MTITYGISAKSEKDYKVVGLSKEENKHFWVAEDQFNSTWYRVLNYSILIFSNAINVQFLFVRFPDVHIVVYIFFTTINIAHGTWVLRLALDNRLFIGCVFHLQFFQNSYFAFSFLHSMYTVNLFLVQLMRFFCTKFRYLAKQLTQLNESKGRKIDRRKLSRLVYEYVRVFTLFTKIFFAFFSILCTLILALLQIQSCPFWIDWDEQLLFRLCWRKLDFVSWVSLVEVIKPFQNDSHLISSLLALVSRYWFEV